jgi:hypothetical protein
MFVLNLFPRPSPRSVKFYDKTVAAAVEEVKALVRFDFHFEYPILKGIELEAAACALKSGLFDAVQNLRRSQLKKSMRIFHRNILPEATRPRQN